MGGVATEQVSHASTAFSKTPFLDPGLWMSPGELELVTPSGLRFPLCKGSGMGSMVPEEGKTALSPSVIVGPHPASSS